MRKQIVAALVIMFLTQYSMATAEPFSEPPEDWAECGWSSPFPYPRNIYWDFAEDPSGGPSPDGAPGAHYEGWGDPALKGSDYVEFTGDFQWYSSRTNVHGATRTGLIGIDNSGGDTTLTGSVIFHIDNSETPGVKHIYADAEHGVPYREGWEGIEIDNYGEMSWELVLPPGHETSGQVHVEWPPFFGTEAFWGAGT